MDDVFELKIVFGTTVSFGEDDLRVINGSVLSVYESGSDYFARIEPEDPYKEVYVQVLPVLDTNGVLSEGQLHVIPAVDAPTVTIDAPSYYESTFTATINFSRPVTGFTLADIEIENATAVLNGPTDPTLASKEYTLDVTASSTLDTVSIRVKPDVEGRNDSGASLPSLTYFVEYDLRPTVSLTGPSSYSYSTGTVSIDITFSEVVTGFELEDLELSGSYTKASLSQNSNVYTLALTVDDFDPTENIVVRVPEHVATDSVGQGNRASVSFAVLVQRRPRVQFFAGTESYDFTDSTVSVKVRFTIATPATLDATHVSITNGTLVSVNKQVTGNWEITANRAAGGNDVLEDIGISVLADASVDNGVGNPTETYTVAHDPYPEVTLSPRAWYNNSPVTGFTLEAQFSEPVTGFEDSAVFTLVNAKAKVSEKISDTLYDIDVTPDSGEKDVQIGIQANSARDASGKGNTTLSPITIPYQPQLTATFRSYFAYYDGTGAMLVYLSFSNPVTGVDKTSVSVSGATFGGAINGTGAEYTFTVVPDGTEKDVVVTVNHSAITDSVGQTVQYSESLRIHHTTAFAATLTGPGWYINGDAFTVVADFGRPVTELEADELTIANATATVSRQGTDGSEFSIVVTPTAVGSRIQLSVPANAVTDLERRGCSTSNSILLDYDPIPEVNIVPSRLYYAKSFEQIDFTFSLNKDMLDLGLDQGDLTVTGGYLLDGPRRKVVHSTTLQEPVGGPSDMRVFGDYVFHRDIAARYYDDYFLLYESTPDSHFSQRLFRDVLVQNTTLYSYRILLFETTGGNTTLRVNRAIDFAAPVDADTDIPVVSSVGHKTLTVHTAYPDSYFNRSTHGSARFGFKGETETDTTWRLEVTRANFDPLPRLRDYPLVLPVYSDGTNSDLTVSIPRTYTDSRGQKINTDGDGLVVYSRPPEHEWEAPDWYTSTAYDVTLVAVFDQTVYDLRAAEIFAFDCEVRSTRALDPEATRWEVVVRPTAPETISVAIPSDAATTPQGQGSATGLAVNIPYEPIPEATVTGPHVYSDDSPLDYTLTLNKPLDFTWNDIDIQGGYLVESPYTEYMRSTSLEEVAADPLEQSGDDLYFHLFPYSEAANDRWFLASWEKGGSRFAGSDNVICTGLEEQNFRVRLVETTGGIYKQRFEGAIDRSLTRGTDSIVDQMVDSTAGSLTFRIQHNIDPNNVVPSVLNAPAIDLAFACWFKDVSGDALNTTWRLAITSPDAVDAPKETEIVFAVQPDGSQRVRLTVGLSQSVTDSVGQAIQNNTAAWTPFHLRPSVTLAGPEWYNGEEGDLEYYGTFNERVVDFRPSEMEVLNGTVRSVRPVTPDLTYWRIVVSPDNERKPSVRIPDGAANESTFLLSSTESNKIDTDYQPIPEARFHANARFYETVFNQDFSLVWNKRLSYYIYQFLKVSGGGVSGDEGYLEWSSDALLSNQSASTRSFENFTLGAAADATDFEQRDLLVTGSSNIPDAVLYPTGFEQGRTFRFALFEDTGSGERLREDAEFHFYRSSDKDNEVEFEVDSTGGDQTFVIRANLSDSSVDGPPSDTSNGSAYFYFKDCTEYTTNWRLELWRGPALIPYGLEWAFQVKPDGTKKDIRVELKDDLTDSVGQKFRYTEAAWTVYDERPVATLTGQKWYIGPGTSEVTATFDQPVTAPDSSDLTLANCTAEVSPVDQRGTTYKLLLYPTAVGETMAVSIPTRAVTDEVGNTNATSANFLLPYEPIPRIEEMFKVGDDRFYDSSRPTFDAYIVFNKAMTLQADASDMYVTNATITNARSGDKVRWYFTVTPDGTKSDVEFGPKSPPTIFDSVNQALYATPRVTIVYDAEPTLTFSSVPTYYNDTSTLTMTATFSQAIDTFLTDAVSVQNADIKFSKQSDTVWDFLLDPKGNGQPIYLKVPVASFWNSLNHLNDQAFSITAIAWEPVPTVVAADTVDGERYYDTTNTTFDVFFEFNKAMTLQADASNFQAGNATLSNARSTDNIRWVVTVTPDGTKSDIHIALAGVITDSVGQKVSGTIHIVPVIYNEAPTVAFSSVPALYNDLGTLTVTATFDQDIHRFTGENVAVKNATIEFSRQSPREYIFLLTPQGTERAIEVDVPVDTFANAVDHSNGVVYSTADIAWQPLPKVDRVYQDKSYFISTQTSITMTLHFNKDVTLGANAITVAGGATLTSVTRVSNVHRRAWDVKVTLNGFESDIAVTVVNGLVTDDVSQTNLEDQVFRWAYHPLLEARLSFDRDVTEYRFYQETPRCFVTWNRALANFQASDVTVTNGGDVRVEYAAERTYLLTAVPTDWTQPLKFKIDADKIRDELGLGNLVSNEVTLQPYDRPEVVITNLPNIYTRALDGKFDLNIHLSRSSSNFLPRRDVSITNGEITELSRTGNTYFCRCEPGKHEEDVTFYVEENVFTDASGNGNVASPEYTVRGLTLPRLSIGDLPYSCSVDRQFNITLHLDDPIDENYFETHFANAVTLDNAGYALGLTTDGLTINAAVTPSSATEPVVLSVAEGAYYVDGYPSREIRPVTITRGPMRVAYSSTLYRRKTSGEHIRIFRDWQFYDWTDAPASINNGVNQEINYFGQGSRVPPPTVPDKIVLLRKDAVDKYFIRFYETTGTTENIATYDSDNKTDVILDWDTDQDVALQSRGVEWALRVRFLAQSDVVETLTFGEGLWLYFDNPPSTTASWRAVMYTYSS